jgi:hypothetical protein
MSRDYRTREAPITAADTRTAMTFLASATAESPANIPVPKGRSKLIGALVAVGPDYAATGSASFFIRLEGDGLEDSPQYVPVGAHGGSVATGARSVNSARLIPLDVGVIPGNTIALSGEMAGADIGTVAIGCTLIFE